MGGATVMSAVDCKGRQIAKHPNFVHVFTGTAEAITLGKGQKSLY